VNYHVRISLKSQQSHGEAEVDMTEDELETRVLAPYRTGQPSIIKGRTVQIGDVERIRISRSEQVSQQLIALLRQEDARRNSQ